VGEVLPVARGRLGLSAPGEVGHEAGTGGLPLPAGHHHRLAHFRVELEHALDLPRLDAEAANLDLPVEPLEEVEAAVQPPADPVAGPVEPLARTGTEGVGDEALRRQVRPAEIPPRESRAADRQLARRARGDRPQEPVEHIQPRVVDRPADRGRPVGIGLAAVPTLEDRPGGDHGGLGRPVVVRDREGQGGGREPLQAVAPHEQRPQDQPRGNPPLGPLQDQLRQGRGQDGEVDLLGRQPGEEPLRGEPGLLVRDVQAGAGREGRPDLAHRGVESHRHHLGHPVVRGQAIGPRVPVDHVQQTGPGDGHPLGPAGRAGGIDHVGRGFRRDGGGVLRRAGIARRLLAHANLDGRPGPTEIPATGHHHGHADLGRDARQAMVRVGGVEGHVGPSRLQDRERSDHHLRRALDVQADRRLGADAERGETAGQPAGLGVELRVGDLPALAGEGQGAGGTAGLLRDPGGDVAERSVRLHARVVPLAQELMPLGLGKKRKVGEAALRILHHAGEQPLQVGGQAPDGGAVEEVGAVADFREQLAGALHEVHFEVEDRTGRRELERQESHAGKGVAPGLRHVVQPQGDLEQGVAGEMAPRPQRFDQPLEGEILVRVGLQRGAPYRGEQSEEGGIAGQARAQGEGVDEEADQRLDLGPDAVGDRRAQHQVVLPRGAREQRVESGEQDHEQGGVPPTGERQDLAGALGAEGEAHAGAARIGDRRPRPVGGQGE
jgi:hypothetical protein